MSPASIETLLTTALIAVAGFLFRVYRHSAVQDKEIAALTKANKETETMPGRLQRLELVVGIDPTGGGGLASQIEGLVHKIDTAHTERQKQHQALSAQLSDLTLAIRELPHTVRQEVADVRAVLDRRILALELARNPTK